MGCGGCKRYVHLPSVMIARSCPEDFLCGAALPPRSKFLTEHQGRDPFIPEQASGPEEVSTKFA